MTDMGSGILWSILLNAPALLGAYWAARHGFRQPKGAVRWLAAAVIFWAWVTIGMQVLGSVGLLGRGTLLAWSVLGAVIGGGTRWNRPGHETTDAFPIGDRRWHGEAILAVGLTLWASVLMGMKSLLLPVKVISDGPIYHLWFAARWWESGSLELIPAPFGDNVVTYFPSNGDLWFAWLMIGWGGDLLAKVGQTPFHLVTGLAVYAMARQVGAGRSAALIASGWMLTCSAFLFFGFEPNVDTILQAGYLAAAFFFLRYAMGDGGGETLALGALAAGCCWGCKPTGLVLVPPLLASVGLAVVLRRSTWRSKLGHLAMLAVLPMLSTGFWYVRNLLLTGNPLYPVQVELFGQTMLTGWYAPEVMKGSRYYIDPSDWRAGVDILLQVLDPRLTPVWLAGLFGFWAIGRGRERSRDRWVWAIAALAMLNAAIYWGIIPYRTQQRFLFPAVGLAAVPVAVLLDRARGVRIFGVLLLALHVLTPQAWPWAGVGQEQAIPWDFSPLIPNALAPPVMLTVPDAAWRSAITRMRGADAVRLALPVVGTVIIGLLSLAAAGLMGRAANRPGRSGPKWAAAGGIGALLVVSGLVVFPWGAPAPLKFFPMFPDYYRGWIMLDRLAGPSGARIAYSGTNLPYYLLGPGMKNRVRYVNINEHRDWLMHDYHREAVADGRPNWPGDMPGWDREEQDVVAWLANLKAERIELLVVARHNPGEAWPIERQWAEQRPDLFETSYGTDPPDPLFRVFRLRRR